MLLIFSYLIKNKMRARQGAHEVLVFYILIVHRSVSFQAIHVSEINLAPTISIERSVALLLPHVSPGSHVVAALAETSRLLPLPCEIPLKISSSRIVYPVVAAGFHAPRRCARHPPSGPASLVPTHSPEAPAPISYSARSSSACNKNRVGRARFGGVARGGTGDEIKTWR